jgi:PAS domain-containing protein
MQSSSSAAGAANTMKPQTFDFTKRKRWADLLITELADTIILVLSPQCKVLYCGPAVTDLLGWNDIELVDRNLLDLINGVSVRYVLHLSYMTQPLDEDKYQFRHNFNDAILRRSNLLTHARLKHRTSTPTGHKETLYEINGYPHFLSEDSRECQCFFAMARPYNSHNTAL